MLYEKVYVVLLRDFSCFHRYFTVGAICESYLNHHHKLTGYGIEDVISVTIKGVTIDIPDSPEDYVAYGSKEDMVNNIPFSEPKRKVKVVIPYLDENTDIKIPKGTIGYSDMLIHKEKTSLGLMDFIHILIEDKMYSVLASHCVASTY